MAVPQLDESTLFPNLAPELQLKVWELSLRGPRVVKIGMAFPNANDPYGERHCVAEKGGSTPVLAIFHACRNSRAVVLKVYQFDFEQQLHCPILFSFENDLLYLQDSTTSTSFFYPKSPLAIKELNSIQRLAIRGSQSIKEGVLPEMTGLRDLYLCVAMVYIFFPSTLRTMGGTVAEPKDNIKLFKREWQINSRHRPYAKNRLEPDPAVQLPRLILEKLFNLEEHLQSCDRVDGFSLPL